MHKIRLFDTFAGVGGFRLALEKSIGKHCIECIGYSEIDKFSKKVYDKRFPNTKDFGNITEIDLKFLPNFDLVTGGFPCQDVSVAGKQDLSKGRTVLVEYLLRVLEIKKPKYFLFENVKGLMSAKFDEFRESIFKRIEDAGYSYDFKVLNTKNFGLPQNRERIFIVGCYTGKFNKGRGKFDFPKGEELKILLKDILQDEVDEKFYMTQEQYNKLNFDSTKRIYNEIAPALHTSQGGHTQPKIRVGASRGRYVSGGKTEQNIECRKDDLSNSLTGVQKDNLLIKNTIKIKAHTIPRKVFVRKYDVDIEGLKKCLKNHKGNLTIKEISEKLGEPKTKVEHYFRKDKSFAIPTMWMDLKKILGITTDEFDKSIMTMEEKDGVFEKGNRIYGIDGISPTLTQGEERIFNPIRIKNATKKGYIEAKAGDGIDLGHPNSKTKRGRVKSGVSGTLVGNDNCGVISESLRIRKLTPVEYERLQGFPDGWSSDIVSNSQAYKQMGNAISIPVVKKMADKLFKK